MSRLVILGSPDPEMVACEELMIDAGMPFAYACVDGVRVSPGNAYRANGLSPVGVVRNFREIVLVECDLPGWFAGDPPVNLTRVDHHKPGDPGFGFPPERYWCASSIGQLYDILSTSGDVPSSFREWEDEDGDEVPIGPRADLFIIAAADHCLEAAYRGRCPGVDPKDLLAFRVEQKAAFVPPGGVARTAAAIRADIANARLVLRGADGVKYCTACGTIAPPVQTHPGSTDPSRTCPDCGPAGKRWWGTLADLRGFGTIAELLEAAYIEGIPFLASVTHRDGSKEVVLQAAGYIS